MTRLIDADALPNEISWDKIENASFWETINEQPTIDAVPLIRCKNCKHHGEQYGNGYCMKDGCYGWYEEDYCSRAERRGEE